MLLANVRVASALAPFVAALVGTACSKPGSGQVTAAWVYDEARTFSRAEAAGPTVKKRLAGMVVDLRFRSDNTFSMTITGGPAPTMKEGTYKSGYGSLILRPTTVDGKAVAPVDESLRAPDKPTLELLLGSNTVVLKRR